MTDSSGNGRDLYDLLVAPEVAAKQRFDYVIIGSGSAGGVLAARLSEDQSVNVLLVEAGAAGRSISIDMPAMLFINAKRAKYNWKFETVPQPELLGRQLYQPRGKTLGGSSAINAMVYMRGHAEDFNRWAKMGAEGWDYPGVLPYFKRSETFVDGGDWTRADTAHEDLGARARGVHGSCRGARLSHERGPQRCTAGGVFAV
jgi:choline dehydrogenase